ncbi:hypothetical protein M441DRAFT_52787 [Trichoderma asperellum CBS 433.97]|uniref:Uncharacterized protein n=1 Tax=Trichoderma asperellum (strain ATCC 204424 / CBS 433.97 / NBRC 101777) TaxID=1042311 RepID=A0A2T3ZME6_TRIA4|nr:hypothetical protein M441DRAFT_52787 [Trichoderma asperellum CBS 433.97]PTB45980.1 hypothetical protein M441DRAFT_52787 [Trichoderma asperellum CBS 433.97]
MGEMPNSGYVASLLDPAKHVQLRSEHGELPKGQDLRLQLGFCWQWSSRHVPQAKAATKWAVDYP